MASSVFFTPSDGWVGDVIPFERDGEFWLYYLHERREIPKPGTPWHLVVTKDFVDYTDRGVGLPHGNADEEDFNAYTGSVVRHPDGTLHMFYTGQNPDRLAPGGTPLQLICHAISTDEGTTWVKRPELSFGAGRGYEPGDWRDPFVCYDESAGLWRMLIAARHDTGPDRRRGVIAQCVSADLLTWSPAEPFWDPRRYITHECPDVFRWGQWWYLVYSEFSDNFTTRYRMARNLAGPWLVPDRDSIDGRAFYASKTAHRDGRHFFVGWIAGKAGNTDDGDWLWAGTMSALEATQNIDGTLGFCFPQELADSFTEPFEPDLHLHDPGHTRLSAPDGYGSLVSAVDAPRQFYAAVELDVAPGTGECGLLLRASADGDQSYIIRLEPKRGRMVFDRWPRRRTGGGQWQVSGDTPFAVELERPCALGPGRHLLEVIVDGDVLVAVADRQVALSTRIYDRTSGRLGVFAGEGTVDIHRFTVRQRTAIPENPANTATQVTPESPATMNRSTEIGTMS